MTSDDEFVKKSLQPLIALNIPGAFTTTAPPDDLDLNNASPAELVKHGVLWRGPQAGGPPSVAAAWKALLSRPWYAKDRIVPHVVPQPGRTHNLRGIKKTDGNVNQSAWSGCVLSAQGQWVTAVGQWVIPTVSQPSEPQGTEGGWNSSSWVGIDGYGSNDVLQAGVEQRFNADGQASYIAWVEWWVQPPPPPCPDPTGCDNNGYP